jgi:two-component system, NtrC family, response regulator HydG
MSQVSTIPPLLGRSSALARVRAFVARAAPVDAAVLIEGETGTGKGHVARLLHAGSPRASGAFVAVNCAGVPEALFESELFGHVRGAFTGAHADRLGLIAAADGGTLFLDEVGELPASQQAKLLAAVEERASRPVGSTVSHRVDIRVVSATCRVLSDELETGRSRPDLFHRLALLRLRLSPLRDRPEDILPLARRFLVRAVERHATPDRSFTAPATDFLRHYPWPGNVRQLAHAVEAAVILSRSARIGPALLRRILDPDAEPRPA